MEGLNRGVIQLDLHLRKVALAAMWHGEERSRGKPQVEARRPGWRLLQHLAEQSWGTKAVMWE